MERPSAILGVGLKSLARNMTNQRSGKPQVASPITSRAFRQQETPVNNFAVHR